MAIATRTHWRSCYNEIEILYYTYVMIAIIIVYIYIIGERKLKMLMPIVIEILPMTYYIARHMSSYIMHSV